MSTIMTKLFPGKKGVIYARRMFLLRRRNLYPLLGNLLLCFLVVVCLIRIAGHSDTPDSLKQGKQRAVHGGSAKHLNSIDEHDKSRELQNDAIDKRQTSTLTKKVPTAGDNRENHKEPKETGQNRTDKQKTEFKLYSSPKDKARDVKQFCKANRAMTSQKSGLKGILHSNHYKVSFCSPHYVADTVSSLVLTVLEFGVRSIQEPYNRRPETNWRLQSVFDLHNDTSSHVVFTRDPFDRLFSTYIRLVYAPIISPLNKQIKRKLKLPDDECSEVTFENFLNYVLMDRNNAKWRPVSSACNPCITQPKYVVKQESLYDDIKFILKDIEATKEESETVIDVIHRYRFSSISYVVGELVGRKFSTCSTWLNAAERAWHALKLIGYINDSVVFPQQKLENEKKTNDTGLLAVVMQKRIQQSPGQHNPKLLEAQRQKAKAKAYSDVKLETIARIRKMYDMDFQAFGYSPSVPK